MKIRKKKKPDFRRIRPTETYSIADLAEAIERAPATVRTWYRQGMPSLDNHKPPIFDGAAAKAWLKKRWEKRKSSTSPNEAFCMRCRCARAFANDSTAVERCTPKVLVISGNCADCGGRMNKFASADSVTVLDLPGDRKRDKCAA